MSLAFNLAKLHNRMTGVNPSVGAIVVKNNKVFSYGATGFGGGPHGEYSALINIKKEPNLELFVSLEPCHHFGKNPPCTNFILDKKIKKIYYSEIDNDPRVQGKGLEFLAINRIKIEKIKNTYKKNFYKNYNEFNKNNFPKVYAKIATTKNYFSYIKNQPKISNYYSNKVTHILRSEINAILIGVNTHNIDNPLLNCRINGLGKLSPSRFIIDPNLKIKINSRLVLSANKIKTYVFYSVKNESKINYLKKRNIFPIYLPLNNANEFSYNNEILRVIGLLGYKNVLVEGGHKTIKSFIDLNLIDIFYFFKNSKISKKNASHSFKKIYMNLKRNFKNNKKLQQIYVNDNSLSVFEK